MRVLHVDTFSTRYATDNTEGLKAAYERIAEVKTFDYRWQTSISNPQDMNDLLVDECRKFDPDLVHLGKCETVSAESVRKMREAGAVVIHFFGDMRLQPDLATVQIGKEANGTLLSTTDPRIVDQYRAAGVNVLGWWDAGTEPALFYPRDVPKKYDITFFGHNNLVGLPHEGNRQRLILMQMLDAWGFDLHLFGNGWKGFRNIHEPVYGDDFAEAASASRITIGINNMNDYAMYASWRRTLNCMASGAFHLTHYVPGLERMFNTDCELPVFHNVYNAVSLVDEFLRDSGARDSFAARGRVAVLERHTWDKRVEAMLGYYERCQSGTTE